LVFGDRIRQNWRARTPAANGSRRVNRRKLIGDN
jgi:hypothetical protein